MRFNKLAAAAALTFAIALPIAGATPAFATAEPAPTTVVTPAEGTATNEAPTAEGEFGKAEGTAEKECIEFLKQGEKVDRCLQAPNPILPVKGEIFFGAIAFFGLLALLYKLLPAVTKTMNARSDKIAGDLKAADSAKAAAEGELANYRAQLADAKNESSRIIDEARVEAEKIRKDAVGRAEAEASVARAKATEDLNAQADRLKGELQTHVKSLSIELAEKVVGQNLDRPTNEALVDRYIAELAR
jgi:F-type H+-transporting ATPase subunit b